MGKDHYKEEKYLTKEKKEILNIRKLSLWFSSICYLACQKEILFFFKQWREKLIAHKHPDLHEKDLHLKVKPDKTERPTRTSGRDLPRGSYRVWKINSRLLFFFFC